MFRSFYIIGWLIFVSCVYEKPLEKNKSIHSIKKGIEVEKVKDSLINDSISKRIKLSIKQDMEMKKAKHSLIDDSISKRRKWQDYYSYIILLNDFDDSLTIYLDTLLVANKRFKTDKSTGACERIKVSWRILIKSNLYFYKGSEMQYKIVPDAPKRYLYIWRRNGVWWHEFLDKRLELE